MVELILLDTDILIDYLRGYEKAVAFIKAHSTRIMLSTIVIAELYAGVKGEAEEAALDNFISLFPIVSVSAKIAKIGGFYKREYGKSHGIGIADALIAATAQVENAKLKTLNRKHYPMIKGLRPAYTK